MWTLKDIEELKRKGKIRGYVDHGPKKQNPGKQKISVNLQKVSREKDWIDWNVLYWANSHALQLHSEYRFHPERKWRFDWCLPAIKIAIEYNGIMSNKSRHTTIKGYNGDMEKINAAQKLGWIVLQYTPLNYRQVITDLNSILDGMGKGSK